MAASVVDLPEPVGPVTSTMPRGLSASSPKILGALSCSSVRILLGMVRNTAPAPRLLVEGVDAETRQAVDLEGEVDLQELFVVLALGVVHDVVHHGVHLLVLQRVDVDAAHIAVHADHGRQAGGKVQVGGLVLDAECQQLGNVHESLYLLENVAGCGTIMTMIAAPASKPFMPASLPRVMPPGVTPASVTLLAVSKTFGPEAVREAHAAGQTAFGENYIQEAVDKMAALADLPLQWHCIGPIQSNKTRLVAEHFDWAQTVDRLKIAQRLSEQRPARSCRRCRSAFRSTSMAAPPSPAWRRDEALALARAVAALPRLQLRGLMCIPDPPPDFEAMKAVFLRAKGPVRAVARRRAGARHAVHGHDGRPGGRHPCRQHHGACGHGHFRRATRAPACARQPSFPGHGRIGLTLPQSAPSHLPLPSMSIFCGVAVGRAGERHLMA